LASQANVNKGSYLAGASHRLSKLVGSVFFSYSHNKARYAEPGTGGLTFENIVD
jgi:hypothetical protein